MFLSIIPGVSTHKEKADLLITGGTVVTMKPPAPSSKTVPVAVTGDTIIAVGPRSELEAKYATHTDNRRHGQIGPADSSTAHPRPHDPVSRPAR